MEAIMSATVPKSPGWFLTLSLTAVAAGLAIGPLAVGAVGAQTSSGPGRVSGVVTDQTGGVVSGATVTISGNATTASQTAETDQFGRYTIVGLSPGSHELRVTQLGFKPQVTSLTVTPGAQLSVDARLRIGDVTETVTLIADGVGQGSRDGSDAAAAASRQLAERPDDVDAQLALAELLYRDEQFGESAVAMERAAALWVANRKTGAPAIPSSSAGGEIKAPKLIRRVNPIYPDAARSAGATGMVILEGIITEDGIVQDLQVLRGAPTLSEAAIGAARQWIYEPPRLNGVPVAVAMTITINFSSN
jgi:TonB family protein